MAAFRTADTIAMKLGIEKTAKVRVRAGIGYALPYDAASEVRLDAPELERILLRNDYGYPKTPLELVSDEED